MIRRVVRTAAWIAGSFLVALFGFAAWDATRSPRLAPWHRMTPADLTAPAIDSMDWAAYVSAEDSLILQVRRALAGHIDAADRVPYNRYYDSSATYPGRFPQDWNRSFVLEPSMPPAGVAVMLHGLTDSPYSMRALASDYARRGFVVVVIRMPGHGTVPGGLVEARWQDWLAAARLAVREGRRRVPAGPLHLVGYSNGGALAMQYSLDALLQPRLARADHIILLSPMIGVTAAARFAGVTGWPAVLPAFARSAWLDLVPEWHPFKYNSFPVNAAVQSYGLTRTLQATVARAAASGSLERLPPVLAFQSVVDHTVIASAVVTALFDRLPANGSAIVLFDINRAVDLGPLLDPSAATAARRLVPPAPRRYRVTLIANAVRGSADVVARDVPAGTTTETASPVGIAWPAGFFSLSHLALPFPITDPLLGVSPDTGEDFGIRLGTMALRGEIGVLTTGPDAIRATSNPFLPYVLARVDSLNLAN